jgi:single-stranded-DNA-specific exonuclease
VFGDYDVDGTTSAALLATSLGAMGATVIPLVASRFDGGYGLSENAATKVLDANPSLLVTCDCGTSDHPRLEALRTRGIDSIVVDHHKVPDEPLPAVAFLNPHRPDCGYPFKGLASVGLALTLAGAVRARLGVTLDLRDYLDLVAVGTIADVMPLSDDNRILTRAGLERLGQGAARPGLRALVREARLNNGVRAHDVGFSIAPMLNAAGRLGAATPTLELLMSRTEQEATVRARQLAALNERRREISGELVETACRQVDEVFGKAIPAGIVVGGEGWHHGVGGIVAGRLTDRYSVPSVVIGFDGAMGVGSARAPRGFPLYEAVKAIRNELERFGGHDAAAGMTVRKERFEAVREQFASVCTTIAARGDGGLSDRIDTELCERDLDGPLAAHLEALEPTGQAQPAPRVILRATTVVDSRVVGTGHLSLKFRVGARMVRGFVRDGVARRARGELGEGGTLDVQGILRADTWMGNGAVQIDVSGARSAMH